MTSPAIIVVLSIVAAAAIADLLLYAVIGNDATISRQLLGRAGARPLIKPLFCLTFGELAFHLFNPATGESFEGWELALRCVVGLGPIAAGLALIAVAPNEDDSQLMAQLHCKWVTIALCTLGFALGGIEGSFVLPQHL